MCRPPPVGRDVVDYFLFDAPGGFCSYFASAMVVMLRLEGVPARIVSGYAMGDYDFAQHAYRVPASSAHAWVEVYFPSYGWVEFEPTTSQAVFNYRAEEAPPPIATQPPEGVVINVSQEAISVGALALGLIGLIGLALILQRRAVARRRSLHQQVHDLYWQMRRSLITLNVTAPLNVTPLELVAEYLQPIESRPRLRAVVDEIAQAYIAATYADEVLTRDGVRALQRAWREMWAERLKARWKK